MHGVTSTPVVVAALAILLGMGPAAWGEEGAAAPSAPAPSASAPSSAGTGGAAAAPAPSGWGSISLGTTFVHTNGNSQAFSQDYRTDDNFLYGIRSLDYHMKQEGWREDITARAVQPLDYGVDVRVTKNKTGFIEAYYDQFPTYYNSTKDFYNFAPFTHSLDRRLITVRRQAGVVASWQMPSQGPVVTLSVDHWARDGDMSTYWSGLVTDGVQPLYRYPQFRDVDEERNRIRLEIAQKVGRFNLKVGIMAQDYDGTGKITSSTFNSSGVLTQKRFITKEPGFTEISPYWELAGDLIEKVLRFEYSGRYSHTETDGTYNEFTLLLPSGVHNTTNNFINNTHDGQVSETEHNFRLVYTPDAKTTIFGGFGMKYFHSDNDALQNDDRSPTPPNGVADRITALSATDRRMVWMGNAGIQVKPLKWLGAALEGRYEHSDLHRDWMSNRILGGTSTVFWLAEGDFDRVEYMASVTAQATPDLKFVGRWGQKRIDYDYHNIIDSVNGATNLGLPGSTRRRINEWSLLTQYKPNPYLSATYKLAGRTTAYFVDKNANGNTANWKDISNSLNLTVTPTDKLTLSMYGSVQRMQMETKAEHAAETPIAGFDGDARSWGVDATYRASDKVTVSGGIFKEYANSLYDYNAVNVYGGVVYKINKSWSADFRYTFAQFNEQNNGGLNDYSAHLFTIGLVGRF